MGASTHAEPVRLDAESDRFACDSMGLLLKEGDARGNLVPDAWFAALAIESGCEWITLDRDYTRFPGLKWNLPS